MKISPMIKEEITTSSPTGSADRSGIVIAGNMLTDHVKCIDAYPKKGMLASITAQSRAVGGCVPNTGIDLAKIDSSIPIEGIGILGDDDSGRYVLKELQKVGISTKYVTVSREYATSYSDVMSVVSTGERTFFHYRGANAAFSPADIPLNQLQCRMLHIAYILLLDQFDQPDAEYGTVMARFLKEVQDKGIRTSIDVVSDSAERFSEYVLPALRYTDNAIMNEIECCGAAGISPRDDAGNLCFNNLRTAMDFVMEHGVGERVILHCPELGMILNKNGEFTAVGSLKLPSGYIKGSVGAGDAFCAGCLYGIYHGLSDREILEFASGAAACNLSAEDSVSGMKSKDEILALINALPRIPI